MSTSFVLRRPTLKQISAVLLIGGFAASVLLAQSQPPPKFSVTSVRPLRQDQQRPREFGCSGNGRAAFTALPLYTVILWAFDILLYQLQNLPNWAGTDSLPSDLYNIEAIAEREVTLAQCKQMVQELLKDRFQLQARRATQSTKVYALVIGKNGPKMERAMEDSKESGVKITQNGRLQDMTERGKQPPAGWTMSQLANYFRLAIPGNERQVMDRTGLEGLYRITLNIGVGNPGGPLSAVSLEYPDAFQAAEQLGLKLEERNEPAEVLVIDRLERPSEN